MYEVVIGLECHAQLDTRSKLFCGCPVVDDGRPNRAICPVCVGHPGALPVLNARAVDLGIMAALATSCAVQATSVFSRKQYFYPDLPKGYQISQHDRPLATGGKITALVDGQRKSWRVHRVHLEEDSGRSYHFPTWTGIDFNRAGTPLAEVVSEPDLRSPAEAEAYLRMMHRLLVTAGVTTGSMDKGHFRCDANVSLREPGAPLGTRVEIKNLNSFRFVKRALEYEVERQTALLDAGLPVVQETRLWRKGRTEPMRGKEDAADYRYMPDPDLPHLTVTDADLQRAVDALPGQPLDDWLLDADLLGRSALTTAYAVGAETVEFLVGRPELAKFFEACVAAGGDAEGIAKWLRGDVARRFKEEGSLGALSPKNLVDLQSKVVDGTVSWTNARIAFDHMWATGEDPSIVIEQRGLAVVGDEGQLRRIVRDVIAAHPDKVTTYRSGKKGLIGFFMGQVMQATKGRVDPKQANQLVQRALEQPE